MKHLLACLYMSLVLPLFFSLGLQAQGHFNPPTYTPRCMPTDSCWLFKDIDGKVSAYTPLAEDDVDDGFLRYIQKDKGPLIEITKENLAEMLKDNEKATSQAEKGRFSKAIKTYNKL